MTVDEFAVLAKMNLISFAVLEKEQELRMRLLMPYLESIAKLSEVADNPQQFCGGMRDFVTSKQMGMLSRWN